MKVVGIDVGPRKGGHVYDGGQSITKMSPTELERYLNRLQGEDNVLIAWDAPLTGPSNPDGRLDEQDLTMRRIEGFFRKGPFKTPTGISVQPYSGCAHWTITRRLLGLPRVGKYDEKDKLPFNLISNDQYRPRAGQHVVEVHPAVALWLWCRKGKFTGPWSYKKDAACRNSMVKFLPSCGIEISNDDELDAYISWYLADAWLENRDVMLLGDEKTGSFLVPADSDLRSAFVKFTPP